MSAHPMHGTKPLERASTVAAQFQGAGRIQLWKVRVKCEDWATPGRPHFLGTRVDAVARAERLGIPWDKVSRV